MPESASTARLATGTEELAKAKFLLGLFQWLGVPALGIIAAFGTTMLMKGRDAQRLDNVEQQMKEQGKTNDDHRNRIDQCVQKSDWYRESDRDAKQLERIEKKVDELRK